MFLASRAGLVRQKFPGGAQNFHRAEIFGKPGLTQLWEMGPVLTINSRPDPNGLLLFAEKGLL